MGNQPSHEGASGEKVQPRKVRLSNSWEIKSKPFDIKRTNFTKQKRLKITTHERIKS
jgi:hypothetical protein